MSRFGLKLKLAGYILSIVNYFLKALDTIDKYFPFGTSVGGVVALALSKVFRTYISHERKWGWWGAYGKFTYIKFW